jgi:hypothetical protein
VAARQRHRLVAARPDRAGAAEKDAELSRVRGPRLRLRRGPLDDQGRDRRGRAGAVLTAALFERFASRGEATSPTSCCRRCASSSAATSRTRDPAEHVRRRSSSSSAARAARGGARRRREAVRPRPRLGAELNATLHDRVPEEGDLPHRPLPRQGGRCRTSSTSASPTRSSSRSGTATTSRACRSRWPRASASKGAASSTRRPARSATSSRTTCSRSSLPRDGAAVGTYAEAIRDEQAKVLRTIRPLTRAHRARPVPRLPRRAGRRARLVRSRPTPRCAARRLVALGRRAVLRARRQVPEATVTEVIVELKNPPQVVFNEPPPSMGNYVRFR